MKLTLNRIAKRDSYTIGKLYIDGEYFCDTVEDKDRGLSNDDTLQKIKSVKVYALTAIPTGSYRISMGVISPKFSQKSYYSAYCGGRMPRLLNVKGFDGILIHTGSNANSSAGCIIVGKNTVVGGVTNSRYYWEQLYQLLDKAYLRGEQITIDIK